MLRISRQIDRDCEFLETERIMDYSLLVGLHFRDVSTGDKIGLSPFLLRTGKFLHIIRTFCGKLKNLANDNIMILQERRSRSKMKNSCAAVDSLKQNSKTWIGSYLAGAFYELLDMEDHL